MIRGGVGRKATAWAYALEREVLQACAERRALAAGTFGAGETMLIAPGGGHAVLTGAAGKVVGGAVGVVTPGKSVVEDKFVTELCDDTPA